jgi:glycerophosphoryl diester phosphodiesterase
MAADLATAHTGPLVIAHRGARAFAPENTLEAFRLAAELGADMVELDVQLTADAKLIVVHDDSLERCSNVRQLFPARSDLRVASFTLDDIRHLDAGSWFARELERAPSDRQAFLRLLRDDEVQRYLQAQRLASYRSGSVRHPTLRESLEQCRACGLGINIELKVPESPRPTADSSATDALSRGVVECVRQLKILDTVLVSSFNHSLLRHVSELEPALDIGVLVDRPLADPVAYCRRLNAAAYHPGRDPIGFETDEYRTKGTLPTEPLRSLLEAGIRVNVWTVNDPREMRVLIDAGVSGIFTDYPNRMSGIISRHGERIP